MHLTLQFGSQTNNLKTLNRTKRDFFGDAWNKLKTTAEKVGNTVADVANAVADVAVKGGNAVANVAIVGWDNSLGHKVSKSINHEGGTFTAEWRPIQILYWQLKMDDAACKLVLNNLSSSGEFAAKTSLMAIVGGLFAAGGVPGVVGTAAAATVAVNFWAIKSIIENNNNGNGVWIGFWFNQPGLGFGSL
ncbi:hypothetical protein [Spiroplasma endosymbiont of Tipula paludosa]|uniref:hypothetical protein n=1 Tax=Spiroplasma endosymbiont of Tipula paludosa TaxID=3066295 RepID=UPI0035C8DD78